jgi:hypothetical protein
MSNHGAGAHSGESTSRLLFERYIAVGRQNSPLLIWLAVLVVTAVVIGRKASGEHIDTADIVLIVLVVAGPLLGRTMDLLPFLGSVKLGQFQVEFRELKDNQLRQQGEIEAAIRFLVSRYLTENELMQLRNMTLSSFIIHPRLELEQELRRIIALGLIKRKPNTGRATSGAFSARTLSTPPLERGTRLSSLAAGRQSAWGRGGILAYGA